MIILLLTYLPDKNHLVQRNESDGAYKVYYSITDSTDLFSRAVDDHDTFRVYYRKDKHTNYIYMGETQHSLYMVLDSGAKLNLFYTAEQIKTRTLFAKDNDYFQAVADECKFAGAGERASFFVV
jgi:hypothetical protein